jgi:hypothetical protein
MTRTVHVLVEYSYGGDEILGVYAAEDAAKAAVTMIETEESARKAAPDGMFVGRAVGIESFDLIE